MGIRRWITEWFVEFLTEPLGRYERYVWNDPDSLRSQVRPGDVLLVEGDNRVSAIIKYLTQSSWSHAAIYIGDEILRRGGEHAERAVREFGEAGASELLVEALPQGVVAAPLTKYIDFNIRLLRPHRLLPEHRKIILDDVIVSIGWRYDLRNILDLARYTLPVSLVPTRFQRDSRRFGSGLPTAVICTSLIGQVFQRVGYPILPSVEFPPEEPPAEPSRGLLRGLLGQARHAQRGIFKPRHPTLLAPRDFDLSPYFEIIKFNVITEGHFDYQQIQWARPDEPPVHPGLEARPPEEG